MVVAIDGPCGAGKSSVADEVAKRMGFARIDSGAMYRCVALYCLQNGVDINDEDAVANAAERLEINFERDGDIQKTFLNGKNVTDDIRTPQIDKIVPVTSSYAKARERMVALQREIASKQSVIMDGRDITSVVLPNADIKIYLDASIEERVRRRIEQRRLNGLEISEKIEKEEFINMTERDRQDKSRAVSPLVITPDSKYILTDKINKEETTQLIIDEIKKMSDF